MRDRVRRVWRSPESLATGSVHWTSQTSVLRGVCAGVLGLACGSSAPAPSIVSGDGSGGVTGFFEPGPAGPGNGVGGLDFGDPGPSCSGASCQPSSCPNGGSTTISGTVYAPSGTLPLSNVMVYVPSSPLTPLTTGVTCSCEVSGDPVASALTDTRGEFVITNTPAGADVPLVIQIGKWRRQFTLPSVAACSNTQIPAGTLKLPARQAEGDLPRIAVTTGAADAMECLVRKLGVDPLEFTTPDGPGRVNYFAGREGTDRYVDDMNDGADFPDAEELWNSTATLSRYDVVLLSCEGDKGHDDNKPDEAFQAMHDYANLGGRIFASHWHQLWLQEGPEPFPDIAEFVDEDDLNEITADVVTTFPKGQALAQWLVNVGASTQRGRIDLTGTQYTVVRENPTYAQRWIATESPETVQYLSANTPLGAPAADQCGRVVLSDIHVSGSEDEGRDTSSDSTEFPEGCRTTDLSPQEKVLAYMLFDISGCIVPDNEVPLPPPIILR
jgi:hypothetical protein